MEVHDQPNHDRAESERQVCESDLHVPAKYNTGSLPACVSEVCSRWNKPLIAAESAWDVRGVAGAGRMGVYIPSPKLVSMMILLTLYFSGHLRRSQSSAAVGSVW